MLGLSEIDYLFPHFIPKLAVWHDRFWTEIANVYSWNRDSNRHSPQRFPISSRLFQRLAHQVLSNLRAVDLMMRDVGFINFYLDHMLSKEKPCFYFIWKSRLLELNAMGLIKDVQQEEYNSCIDQAWAKTMLATSSKSAFCRWSQEVNICFAFAFSFSIWLLCMWQSILTYRFSNLGSPHRKHLNYF